MTSSPTDRKSLHHLIQDYCPDAGRLPGPFPLWRGACSPAHWAPLAEGVWQAQGRLVALWWSSEGAVLQATYVLGREVLWASLAHSAGHPVADISPWFPGANRLQRAAADLASGALAFAAADQRPWLDHGCWAQQGHQEPAPNLPYAFVPVTGEGVHEIAVGPVHAGIIEPGHFRFSVVGEKVLRLEAHLGYTHKGAVAHWRQLPPLQGHRLAARLCGDSTVAYSWAYCMALEAALGWLVPERSLWLRALLLERERVANHLGDLGALGNDAGFAVGLAHFSRLREDWLRLSNTVFGHRLLMDRITPGGVCCDLQAPQCALLQAQCAALEPEVLALRDIYEGHAGLQDRFGATGQVLPALARQLGLTGLAGRASGIARDLRRHPQWAPYNALDVQLVLREEGDVAARVAVRFDETLESLRLIRLVLEHLPPAEPAGAAAAPALSAAPGSGLGRVEGWRGEIQVALQLQATPQGPTVSDIHLHDPSWHNWPVLEHAILGNIVPDFPLINKSFNLCYSGHDQ